jgi:iron complex transport system permease protein
MKTPKIIGISLLVMTGLFFAAILSLAIGTKTVAVSDVFNTLMGRGDVGFSSLVVLERIPRTVFGLLAGGALGISGLLMQSITRNPIADPSILGINSGASLFVVSGIAFFHITSAGQYIGFAILGAAVTAAFVYGVGSMGGGATPLKLALAGAAVSTAATALVSVTIMPRSQVLDTFRFWQIGSISGAGWSSITALLPFFIGGSLIAIIIAPALDVLALGDDAATGLGAKPGLIRLIGSIAGVLLCGATTALAGPIGFVGLMIPHTVRLIWKGDLRKTLLLSAAGGAFLLTVSDVMGRVLGRPGEVEVGIITAFLGAPVFIIIAIKSKG